MILFNTNLYESQNFYNNLNQKDIKELHEINFSFDYDNEFSTIEYLETREYIQQHGNQCYNNIYFDIIEKYNKITDQFDINIKLYNCNLTKENFGQFCCNVESMIDCII